MAETLESYQRLSDEAQENSTTASATSELQQPPDASREIKPRIKYKVLLYWFGVTEIVFGSVSILLAIATLIVAPRYTTYTVTYFSSWNNKTYHDIYNYPHYLTYPSQGIWAGAFLIVTGILGVVTKSKPSVSIYNANMALSIISANFMLAFMVISIIAANNYATRNNSENTLHSLVAIHSILAVIGIAAMIVCILHSAYCCAGVCCRRPRPYQGSVVYAPQPYGVQHPQQMVQLANGQFILVPIQPVAAPGYPGALALTTSDITHQIPQGGAIVPPMNVQFPFVQPLGSRMPSSVQSVPAPLQTPTAHT